MVNGIGAVFRGFRRSQFRVTFRPDDETVAGHRRRTGCADILGARISWVRGHPGCADILGARTSWERGHPGSADILGARTSWERGHPGCAGLWPAIRSILALPHPWWELEGGLRGGYGDDWKPVSDGNRRSGATLLTPAA